MEQHRRHFYWVHVFWICLSFGASGASSVDDFRRAFPIVEPDPGHTKLRLSSEGLEILERITTPIAAVAVIANLGLYVSVYDVHSISGGFIFLGTARRPTQNHFRWVWEYGAANNKQENAKASGKTYPIDEIAIRFRVHNINYPPTPLEQPKDARPFSPMVITESLDNDGLGPLSWWE